MIRANPRDASRSPRRLPWAQVRIPLALALGLALLLSGCYVLHTHTTIEQLRDEISRAEAVHMDPEARYHVEVAKGLLAAAERQYEEADFTAASRFARGGVEQVARALGLQDFHQTAAGSENRGDK